MQRGEAYFCEASAELNNGGERLTKQAALNWLQKYTWRDERHPVEPWPLSKALKLLAGVRVDTPADFDPAFPLDGKAERLKEALDDASQAFAMVLNSCEDTKSRKRRMRFFELENFRFALRLSDDVDLLRREEYFTHIANEKFPLRLYHKVAAVLFSHEYFSRDVPVFGLFHDFARERGGRTEFEAVDVQLWQRLREALVEEYCSEVEGDGLALWEIPDYVPFSEPVFTNKQATAIVVAPGGNLSGAPKGEPLPDDYEIASGVRVGHIRALFDRDGKRYSSELEAAVMVWASFEDDPEVAKGGTVKDEIKNGRLTDWDGPSLSEAAKERIAVIVNWNKTPAKH